jgi:NAD(P)-dependent dehydrogenase (short-subunit alcohol dehydrogenase family)
MKNSKSDKFSLAHPFAIITGAAGLLGKEHSVALLESGYNLILTDLNLTALKKFTNSIKNKFNNKIIFFKMDVSNEKSIFKVKKFINKKKLKIKILVNNAAIDSKINKNNIMSNTSNFEKISLVDWNKHLSVGLTGAMLCAKIFGDVIYKSYKNGIILNIASDLSVIAPKHSLYGKNTFKPVMYSVIKHGIIGLTKYISTYWHKKGIRCNSLSPGPVFNNQSKRFIKKLLKEIPLGRMANKNEYRESVKFLCSDKSSYMTGQNLIVDGGRSVW